MNRAMIWALVALGITLAIVAVFLLAAALLSGNPGRLYLIVCVVALALGLVVRLAGARFTGSRAEVTKGIGLIVDADEPAIFCSSVAAAEAWMEPDDVLDGVHTAAYGPGGEPYRIAAVDGRVSITRMPGEPDRPEELKALLMRYFEARGEPVDSSESLSVMLSRCRPTYSGL
jgi:hypothetical protein